MFELSFQFVITQMEMWMLQGWKKQRMYFQKSRLPICNAIDVPWVTDCAGRTYSGERKWRDYEWSDSWVTRLVMKRFASDVSRTSLHGDLGRVMNCRMSSDAGPYLDNGQQPQATSNASDKVILTGETFCGAFPNRQSGITGTYHCIGRSNFYIKAVAQSAKVDDLSLLDATHLLHQDLHVEHHLVFSAFSPLQSLLTIQRWTRILTRWWS